MAFPTTDRTVPHGSAAPQLPYQQQQQPHASPLLPITTITTRRKLGIILPLALLLCIVLAANVVGGLLHTPEPPFYPAYGVSSPVFGFAMIAGLWFGVPLLVTLAGSGLVEDTGASVLVGVAGAAVIVPVLFVARVGAGDLTVVLTWAAPSFWTCFALDQRFGVGVRVTGWLAGVIDRRREDGERRGSAADAERGKYVGLSNAFPGGEGDTDETASPPRYDELGSVQPDDGRDAAGMRDCGK